MIIDKGEGRFEAKHRHKDGTIVDIEASIQYREIDGGGYLSAFSGILPRKIK